MKLEVDDDSNSSELDKIDSLHRVNLPTGLFGFSEIRSMELVFDKEEKKDGLAFIVIEPGGIIPNYSVEISDRDVESLEITGAEDTMILNIVTLPHDQSGKISLNLVGPIIVNRRSLVGKQCIINNHEQYSARHILDVGAE